MTKMIRNNSDDRSALGLRWLILLIAVFAFTAQGFSQIFGEPQSGKAEPAIEAQPKYDEGLILFQFDLDESHHITDLKNNFFKVQLEKNDFIEIREVVFPGGVSFGDEMVFKGAFTVKVYIKSLQAVTDPVKLNFKVSYQICREKPQEVCFPPEEKEVAVTIDRDFVEAKIEKAIETPTPSAAAPLEDLSSKTSGVSYKPKGGNGLVLLTVALLLLGVSFFVGIAKFIDEEESWGKFIKVIVILVFFTGVFLFLKALDITYYPEQYSQKSQQKAALNWLADLEQGKNDANREKKHLLIDTSADWCIACKELDEYTFSDPEVAKVLKDYVLVKLDFTKGTSANKEMQNRLGVIGLPTVMLLSPQGEELRRFSGYYNKKDFLGFLKGLRWLRSLFCWLNYMQRQG